MSASVLHGRWEDARARFDALVDRSAGVDGCWPWTARVGTNGYGVMSVGSKTDGTRGKAQAHRMAVFLSGADLTAGSVVMHSCDNRRCCNPAHLSVGSQRDNVRDCLAKGRFVAHSKPRARPPSLRGESNPRAKLTEAAVIEIRRRIAAGDNAAAVGRDYRVSATHIGRVSRMENWK